MFAVLLCTSTLYVMYVLITNILLIGLSATGARCLGANKLRDSIDTGETIN